MRGDGPDEENGNFIQLLRLLSYDDPPVAGFLLKKTDKYCSHQIQNELLQVMANKITQKIASCVQGAKYYSIMADEVTDASNREQVIICLRWVSDDFKPHDDYIGLYKVESIKSDIVFAVLKDTLL